MKQTPSGSGRMMWGCRLYQNVRLRSANRGNANNVWNVNTAGNANNNNATNANRPAPDCEMPGRPGALS